MRRIIEILSLLILLSFGLLAQKQDLQFSHLTSQDGLGSNTVFAILQDDKGFLWFGTYDGLSRYDGYNFETFRTVEGDTTSLSGNQIHALCKSDNGDIWVATWYNGLNQFDPKSEKFIRYLHDENDTSSISSDQLLTLLFDKEGYLWIGTHNGLNKLNLNSQKFTHYLPDPNDPESISDNAVYVIIEERYGLLWIGTGRGGLNLLDKKTGKFLSYKYNPVDSRTISGNWIMSLMEDKEGNLWIGTSDAGINKFDLKSRLFNSYNVSSKNPLCSDQILSLFEDSDRNFWIGSNNRGLSIFNRKTGVSNCYLPNSTDPKSINDITINKIFEDRSGVLWFGTWNGGVNKYNKYEKKFLAYSYNSQDPNGLSTNSIYPIFVDSFGDLWLGTDVGGINIKRRNSNKFEHYLFDQNNPFSISSNTINGFCENANGDILIATDFGGINKYDRKKNRFTQVMNNSKDPLHISYNRVTRIFIDSKGDYWIGFGSAGVDRIINGTSELICYEPDINNPKSISSNPVYSINEDHEGNLWFGTLGQGLNKFIRNTEEFIHYTYNSDDPLSLSNNEIFVIHISEDSSIWIGTTDGLNKFNKVNETFQRYKVEDGLPSNNICGILEDEKNNLWISTYKGLSKFNPETENFRNFDVHDGLLSNEFNQWSYFKDNTGRMYFGGTNGFIVFHPDSLNDNPYPPPIVITDFQLSHKPVAIGYDLLRDRTILEKSILETTLITLDHSDRDISFEFAALDYRNPKKNLYAYKMEGFDNEWTITTGNKRYVTYTNLDPGDYVFRVKGSNNDGLWNEIGSSISIIINPPWWATWWAYLLYSVTLILLIITIRGYDLKRQRLKHQLELEHEHAEKLEEIDRMKSRFFANISHEFRTPLTLILGPAENIISNSPSESLTKQAGMIKRNAIRLLGLINQLLDLSKLESGKLKLTASPRNISAFVKGVAMSFESIAERKDIALKIILEKEVIPVYFDREKMEQILINILSNAFKFTREGGKVSIRVVDTEKGKAEITVRDSGIGIPSNEIPKIFDRFYQVDGTQTRQHEGTGIGMALTKELVELHKGEILIDSAEGEWTEVKLIFLLGKDHLAEDEIIEKQDEAKQLIEQEEDTLEKITSEEVASREKIDDRTIILIVEDNSEVREYIKEAISTDYHVEEAMNGEQGLRKAEKLIPDLIISDIMMPVMDGNEMTRKLKTDEKTSHIPIIHLTAKSDQESKIEGLESGADAFVTKPFSVQELEVRIKALIELRRKLQEKFSKGEILAKPDAKKLSKIDQNYMGKLLEVVNTHLSEEEFTIEDIGGEIGMSRSQIYRKLKAITGKSPSLFLRSVRLNKAKELIQNREATISEISYKVGFSSPAYFSRCFKEEFGHSPSDLNQ